MAQAARPLAVITGASSGIGYELAHICARNGYDLVIAADRPEIQSAAEHFRSHGVHVDAVEADLATIEGVDKLYAATHGMPVDCLLANAGHGLGRAFLDQDFATAKHVVDTNITGTIYLIQKIGRDMRRRGMGRILITGSVAGFIPGTFQAVYNGTKAFVDSFAFALRHELMGSGVSVTCLMPGATDTEFFERAGMTDTRVGQGSKDDPAFVAQVGFDAMMRGDGDIVAGLKNKIQTSLATITPSGMLAEQHRKMAEPLRDGHGAHQDDESHHESHMGLWSVMVPAGLAVAAGVALMSGSRSRPARHVEHVDWRSHRERGYVPPSRSSSYPDAGDMRSSMHSESRSMGGIGETGAATEAGSRRAGDMRGASTGEGLRSSEASRLPYETSNTGRQALGDQGAYRNARIDDPHGQRPITE